MKRYFLEFEEKFKDVSIIDSDWYEKELGVKSFCKPAKCLDTKNNKSEEWYRARFVYAMVKSGKFPKEKIGVEISLPKGNRGKAIQPDIVVFTDLSWISKYIAGEYEEIRKQIILIGEVKNHPKDIEKAIEKQIEVALERRLSNNHFEDLAYGVYIDNLDDIILLKKEGLANLERYDIDKMITASKNIVRLNLALRDDTDSLPTYDELISRVNKLKAKYEFKYTDLSPLSEEGFQAILDHIQRAKDLIQEPRTKDLLVEVLTMKVHDENNIKHNQGYSEFYITSEEIRNDGFGNQVFRKRMHDLLEDTKNHYTTLQANCIYGYHEVEDNLIPHSANAERMVIEMIKAFQGKSILEGSTSSFNQTIFNNFGDEVEKSVAGQFFTPIPIISGIVPILNPRPTESVVDPCSGICDMLAMCWKHSQSVGMAHNYYGFDISSTVLKLAELNLVINGAGTGSIHQKNSLYEKMLVDNTFTNMTTFTPENYHVNTWQHKDDRNKNVKKYRIVITNPPFGKGRDLKTGKDGKWGYGLNENVLSMYETWTLCGKPKSIDMGILFLENAYKSLEEGGRMAIVLSNSITSIASWEVVRRWFLSKVRLVAILDMPQNTFGETGVATTILVAYKPRKNEQYLLEDSHDYEVFTRDIKYTGYEVKTVQRNVVFEPIKKYDPVTFEDTGELLEEFSNTIQEFKEYLKSQELPIKNSFGGENFNV